MAVQRPRPVDALTSIMSAFKDFEKKLDKLQEEVKYHGNTLLELHSMVTNLSSNDQRLYEEAKEQKRSKKSQRHEDLFNFDEAFKNKPKSLQPLPPKLRTFPNKKYIMRSSNTEPTLVNHVITSPKSPTKIFNRPHKAESPRKATTLRTQKIKEIKRVRKN